MKARIITLLLLAILLSGCAGPIMTPALFTDVKAPMLNVAYYGATTPNMDKMGTAEATSFLGILLAGDASIEAAMADGKITKLHHVTYRQGSLFFIISTYTIIVYGE
jgi:PBP1b-binding outer membrane lipoprotein LpoB